MVHKSFAHRLIQVIQEEFAGYAWCSIPLSFAEVMRPLSLWFLPLQGLASDPRTWPWRDLGSILACIFSGFEKPINARAWASLK
ncbi:hypothetical protein CCHR01_17719 [Colletotrichum chrysophilum]|uniref:Uncharacterized protein n=1 Tax=Colletotrichum chrysophilum TaxID=1836956 RepID=A0AAD9EC79_9PEZI|nr:hypothetical protein CCHR01_17719 [Colletotrichum chrysophilum]